WRRGAGGRRFAHWRTALEVAGDAGACDHVDGSALAAALIEAARMSSPAAGPAVAGLVTSADGARAFADRIHRLLEPHHAPAAAPVRPWAWWAAVIAAVGVAIVAGSLYGEDVVAWLPGLGGR